MRHSSITILVLAICLIGHPARAQLLDPPQLVGQVETPDDAFDVLLTGSYALVADYAGGLHVVDVSDVTAPTIVSTHNTPGFATHIALIGNTAFVADHAVGGVRVVTVSNKLAPGLIGSYVTGQAAVMVVWHDGLLAVGYLEDSFELVDVSNPTSPAWVATVGVDGPVRDAVFDGDYLLVADSGYGLRVFDISVPGLPSSIGSATGNRPVGVARDGDVAYLADLDGLKSYDITDRTAPLRLGTAALPGPGVRVRIDGTFAFTADHVAGGLQVVDVTTPSSMAVATGYVTGNYAHGVAISGEFAYLVDGEGLKVFHVLDAEVPVRGQTLGGLKSMFSVTD